MGRPRIRPLVVTPEDYARTFDTPHGQRVLEDLVSRYGGNPYHKGGLEAQRETDFACGENNVVNRITSQIFRATNPSEDAPDE